MAGNLSVGGVTGATNTVSVAEADSLMTKIQKRKIELPRQEQEITKQMLEMQRKHEAEMVKAILKVADVTSRQMLIMKLRKNGYIQPNIKNPTDADIIKGWNDYMNDEIKRTEPKWA